MREAQNSAPDLPLPGADALAHSRALVERIRDELSTQGGVIPFSTYMELALYAPGLGYYSAGARNLGREGDFVTAPEISAGFGHCVAHQIAEMFAAIEVGSIVEAGAGLGTLAADILEALAASGSLPRRYGILERSADLRERQAATLQARVPAELPIIEWLDDFPPPGFEGVVIANELLDALPAHRFRITRGGVDELGVGWSGERLEWRSMPASETIVSAVRHIEGDIGRQLAEGYESEWCALGGDWVAELGRRLSRGALLLFDYGYSRRELYHPDRATGTLRCHYRHRAHDDPFWYPGLQDMSVHVDFTALAESADASGLDVSGFTTQANFLLGTGILEYGSRLSPGSREHAELTAGIKRLTLPGEMGEAIKVLALTRDLSTPLSGFALRDLCDRL